MLNNLDSNIDQNNQTKAVSDPDSVEMVGAMHQGIQLLGYILLLTPHLKYGILYYTIAISQVTEAVR